MRLPYMKVLTKSMRETLIEVHAEIEAREPKVSHVSPLTAEIIIRQQFGGKLKPVTKPLHSKKPSVLSI